MRVDVYARVSTEDQNLGQQIKYIKKFCRSRGFEVMRVVADSESGLTPLVDRRKFNALLSNPLRPIVVYNLDRLTRNWDDVVFIEGWFRRHWGSFRLISASEVIDLSNASGRLMFRLKMAVSCYMPEDMREKQIIGIARARAEGKYLGRRKGAVGRKKK